MTSPNEYTPRVCIIGAGVIGCAVADALAELGLSPLVIERNDRYGQGISSRNSEVIHSGIYYPFGSLKARLCIEGRRELYSLASEHRIAHRRCGKMVVATNETELPALEQLKESGDRNGVEGLMLIPRDEVRALEPTVEACAALLCPESGIISADELCHFFYRRAAARGAEFAFRTEVVGLEFSQSGWIVTSIPTTKDRSSSTAEPFSVRTRFVINASGLFGDRIAALAGIDIDLAEYRLHWVKGEYFSLSSRWRNRLQRLVYPLPEHGHRGLGIHATIDLAGSAKLGPNALELGANTSSRTEDYTVDEFHRDEFFDAARCYLPSLQMNDLSPAFAGIRPKLSPRGGPPRDFIVQEESHRGLPGLVNLLGIESPGLTAAPALAKYVSSIVKNML